MHASTDQLERGSMNGDRRRQWIKWSVYGLLLLNFGFYFVEELEIASHALRRGGTFLQWAQEFATTIDELGWFGLLFVFELETYLLSDEAYRRRRVRWGLVLIRFTCYVLLFHTLFARFNGWGDFLAVTEAEDISNLCQLAGGDISFSINYLATLITESNCQTFSDSSIFYYLDPTVITDQRGYEIRRQLTWIDLQDSVVWMLVVVLIDVAVRLQNRNIVDHRLSAVGIMVRCLYALLLIHGAFWVYLGHWVWGWDQFLWIAGFWVIEGNLADWKTEILDESSRLSGSAGA